MAATSTQINNFKYDIITATSIWFDKLSNRIALTGKYNTCQEIKGNLLIAYLNIVVDYFDLDDTTTYASNNFFTTTEIQDIIQHINNILKTNYCITLD